MAKKASASHKAPMSKQKTVTATSGGAKRDGGRLNASTVPKRASATTSKSAARHPQQVSAKPVRKQQHPVEADDDEDSGSTFEDDMDGAGGVSDESDDDSAEEDGSGGLEVDEDRSDDSEAGAGRGGRRGADSDEDDDEIGDDEEIDEDEAFNSDDEKKYGAVINPILSRLKKTGLKIGSQKFSARAGSAGVRGKAAAQRSESDDDDDASDEEEEEEGAVSLADVLDVQLSREAAAKQAKAKQQQQQQAGTKRARKSSADEDEDDEAADDDDDDSGVSASDSGSDDDEDEDEDGPLLTDEQHAKLMAMINKLDPAAAAAASASIGNKGQNSNNRRRVAVPELTSVGLEGEYGTVGETATSKAGLRAAAAAAAMGLLEATAASSSTDGAAKKSKRSKADDAATAAAASELDLGVDLGSLVSSLSGTQGFGALRKRLEKLVGRSVIPVAGQTGHIAPQPMAPPASKIAVERATRAEAYAETSKYVGKKWADLVAINRQAPHLSYSAEASEGSRTNNSTAAMAAKFQPTNEFEARIAATLAASGMGAVPGSSVRDATGKLTSATGDAAILAAERAELQAANAIDGMEVDETGLPTAPISAQALQERQRNLAKMRALLFYDELKRRRINKIKSKTYRRLRKRSDMRKGTEEIERLKEVDPEAARALLDAEAKVIAKERMTLKHRAGGKGVGGSKWVKRVLARGGGSGQQAESREALVEHMKRAQELQSKIRGDKARAEEDDDDDDDDLDADLDGMRGDEDSDTDDDDYSDDDADVIAKGRKAVLASVGLSKQQQRSGSDDESDDGDAAASGSASKNAGSKDDLPEMKGLFGMRFMKQAAERARSNAREEALSLAADMERQEKAMRKRDARKGGSAANGGSDEWGTGAGFDDSDDDDDASGAGSDAGHDNARDADDDEVDAVGGDDNRASNRGAVAAALAKRKKASADNDDRDPGATGRRKFDSHNAKVAAGGKPTKAAASASTAAAPADADGVITVKTGGAIITTTNAADVGKKRARVASEDGVIALHADDDDSEAAGNGAAAAPAAAAGAVRNPWLGQGKVRYTDGAGAGPSGGDDNGASSNPWLANAFSTGEHTGGRHAASKRASAAANASTNKVANTGVIDVAGALSAIADNSSSKKAKNAAASSSAAAVSASVIAPFEASLPADKSKIVVPASASAAGNNKQQKNDDADADNTANSSKSKQVSKSDERAAIAAQQAELIRRAFVGAGALEDTDLQAERDAEDAENAESGKPANTKRGGPGADQMQQKAGWGSWAGMGAPAPGEQQATNQHRQRGFGGQGNKVQQSATASAAAALAASNKGAAGPRRRDAGLMGVLISEKRDKKLASAHQAIAIPHPFRTREEYEASLRQPLGREFNTLAATTALTKPEWVTKAGVIIAPIQHSTIVRGKGVDAARAGSAAASLGQGKNLHKKR